MNNDIKKLANGDFAVVYPQTSVIAPTTKECSMCKYNFKEFLTDVVCCAIMTFVMLLTLYLLFLV